MAVKEGKFFTNQPGTVPTGVIDDWDRRWNDRLGTAVARASFVGASRVDFQNNIGTPSATNFAQSLPDSVQFQGGLNGQQVKLKQRANIMGRGSLKWFVEYNTALSDPNRVASARAKGRRNMQFLSFPLAVTGIRALFHGISGAVWRFIDQDVRWRRVPGSQVTVITDDQDACFKPELSRQIVASLAGLTTQTLTIMKEAMEANVNSTALTAFAVTQNARQVALATGALKAGLAIDVGVVSNPVLGIHVKCGTSPLSPTIPDFM